MTDNEILLSLSNMLDPIREDIREIKCDIVEMKSDIAELKNDVAVLKNDMTEVKNDVAVLKHEMSEMKNDVAVLKNDMVRLENNVVEISTRLKRVELNQENIILPRLETIEACYTSTYERYKNSVEDYDTLKQDMSVVKKVVAEHSKKLQMIS